MENEQKQKNGMSVGQIVTNVVVIVLILVVAFVGFMGFNNVKKDQAVLTQLSNGKDSAITKLADGSEEVTIYANEVSGEETKSYSLVKDDTFKNEVKVTITIEDGTLKFTEASGHKLEDIDEYLVASLMGIEDASTIVLDPDYKYVTLDSYKNGKNTARWSIISGDVINVR